MTTYTNEPSSLSMEAVEEAKKLIENIKPIPIFYTSDILIMPRGIWKITLEREYILIHKTDLAEMWRTEPEFMNKCFGNYLDYRKIPINENDDRVKEIWIDALSRIKGAE